MGRVPVCLDTLTAPSAVGCTVCHGLGCPHGPLTPLSIDPRLKPPPSKSRQGHRAGCDPASPGTPQEQGLQVGDPKAGGLMLQ